MKKILRALTNTWLWWAVVSGFIMYVGGILTAMGEIPFSTLLTMMGGGALGFLAKVTDNYENEIKDIKQKREQLDD